MFFLVTMYNKSSNFRAQFNVCIQHKGCDIFPSGSVLCGMHRISPRQQAARRTGKRRQRRQSQHGHLRWGRKRRRTRPRPAAQPPRPFEPESQRPAEGRAPCGWLQRSADERERERERQWEPFQPVGIGTEAASSPWQTTTPHEQARDWAEHSASYFEKANQAVSSVLERLAQSKRISPSTGNVGPTRSAPCPPKTHPGGCPTCGHVKPRPQVFAQVAVADLFSKKTLHTRFEDALDFLYGDLRDYQCKGCGLRFIPMPGESREDVELRKREHHDYHFKKNLEMHNKNKDGGWSRGFFQRKYNWEEIESHAITQSANTAPELPEWLNPPPQKEKGGSGGPASPAPALCEALPGDGVPACCVMCQDVFVCEYSQEEEMWLYPDACRLDGKLFHVKCSEPSEVRASPSREEEGGGSPSKEDGSPGDEDGSPGDEDGLPEERSTSPECSPDSSAGDLREEEVLY